MNLITEVEKSVLATLMAKPDLYYEHAHTLSRKIFSKSNTVADCIFKRIKKGEKFTTLLVHDETKVDVFSWMEKLSIQTLKENIQQLTKRYYEHYMLEYTMSLMTALRDGQDLDTAMAIFDERRNKLFDGKNLSMTHFADLADEAIALIEKAMAEEGMTGIPTGFTKLDKLTGGWQPTDQVIVAARPGMGKSALAMQFALEAARQGKTVIFNTLEMGEVQLVQRIISGDTEIVSSKLRFGDLTDAELEKVKAWRKTIGSLSNLRIDFPRSFEDLKTKARVLNHQKGVDLIVTDYIQLIEIDKRGANKTERLGDISRDMKLLAKELKCTNILLSQLSRDVEKRGGDKKPQLSDLRDSGAIEQDADIVIFPYRKAYYSENSVDRSAELLVKKNRGGALKTIPLLWDGDTVKFLNPIEHYEKDGFSYLPPPGYDPSNETPF